MLLGAKLHRSARFHDEGTTTCAGEALETIPASSCAVSDHSTAKRVGNSSHRGCSDARTEANTSSDGTCCAVVARAGCLSCGILSALGSHEACTDAFKRSQCWCWWYRNGPALSCAEGRCGVVVAPPTFCEAGARAADSHRLAARSVPHHAATARRHAWCGTGAAPCW